MKKRLFAVILASLLAASVLTSCGDSSETTTSASTAETTTAQTTTSITETTASATTASETATSATTASTSQTTETTTVKTQTPIETITIANKVEDLVWESATGIRDDTGMAVSYGNKENPSKHRMTMTSYIKVAPGDTISLNSNEFVFILYGYTDEFATYENDSYIDIDPNSDSNWGTSYTFKEGEKFGNGNIMQYPLYVRILIKEKTKGATDIPEDLPSKFTFSVASLEGSVPPVATTAATEKPAEPVQVAENVSDLVWEEKTGVKDQDGTLYTHEFRTSMSTYIKVTPGDTITLDSKQYVFILYGYDENYQYIKDSYIDVSPADPNSNWGNSYTFAEGTSFGNGNAMKYPMYIRILIKEKSSGKIAIPENIEEKFTFEVASLGS